MKKFCSIILTIIILTLSLSVCSFAQDPVVLSIQDEKVYAGDEFTVNVFISDNSKLSGAVIDINYDNDKLEFISAKEGAILDTKGNISIRNINGDKSSVRFTYMSSSASVNIEGILFTITFKALETSSGKTNLEIVIPNAADFINSNLEKIPYSVENSEITILNNISLDISETPTSETTSVSETSTQDNVIESSSNISSEKNDNNDNNNTIKIVLALVIVAMICSGIVVVIKKRK